MEMFRDKNEFHPYLLRMAAWEVDRLLTLLHYGLKCRECGNFQHCEDGGSFCKDLFETLRGYRNENL